MTATKLEKLDFPLLSSLKASVFRNTTKLTTLILRSPVMCTIVENEYLFYQSPISLGTGYIYVPSALIDAYKADSLWNAFSSQFRALEDYTVDGTATGELDETKI